MMRARERLYLTADRDRVVRAGDPKAAFLYASEGDEIPDTAAAKFGLVDGRLKTSAVLDTSPVLAVGTVVVEPFTHLGRAWAIVEIGGSFFARSDQVPLAAEGPIEGSDIGPYGTAAEARAWVDAIDTSWSSTPPGEKPEHPAMPAKPETPPAKKPEAPPAKKPAAKKAAAKKAG